MILERPISLPKRLAPVQTKVEVPSGKATYYYTAKFTKFRYNVNDRGRVDIWGKATLTKWRELKWPFGRPWGKFPLWRVSTSSWATLMSSYGPNEYAGKLITEGLKQGLLLHQSMIDEAFAELDAQMKVQQSALTEALTPRPHQVKAA